MTHNTLTSPMPTTFYFPWLPIFTAPKYPGLYITKSLLSNVAWNDTPRVQHPPWTMSRTTTHIHTRRHHHQFTDDQIIIFSIILLLVFLLESLLFLVLVTMLFNVTNFVTINTICRSLEVTIACITIVCLPCFTIAPLNNPGLLPWRWRCLC